MPDLILYILLVLWIFLVVAFLNDTQEPIGLVGFIPAILVVLWIVAAWEENAKEPPHIYGTYKAVDVDGAAVLNINGVLINLNEKLNRNVKEGEEFEVYTYQKMNNGIYFLMRNPYSLRQNEKP